MYEAARKPKLQNPDVDVVMVLVSGPSRGHFYDAAYIHVVEMRHGCSYKKVDGKDVLRHIATYEYNDCASSGPNSRYARVKAYARADFDEAVAA